MGRRASGCSALMNSIPYEARVPDSMRAIEMSEPPEGSLQEEDQSRAGSSSVKEE